MELFEHRAVAFVWRRREEAFKPRSAITSVKHDGGNVVLWGFFSLNGMARLVPVGGIMTKEADYLKTLQENVNQSAEELSLLEH